MARRLPIPAPDARRVALVGLFVLAGIAALRVGKELFLPLLLAVLFKLLFEPVVSFGRRLGLPAVIAAGLVPLSLLGGLVWGVATLREPAADWLIRLPESLRRVERRVAEMRRPVEQVSEAAERVEEMTTVGGEEPIEVEIKEPSLLGSLFENTVAVAATAAVVLVLLFFLLASEDLFLRKLVRVLPHFGDRRRAVLIVRRVQRDISRYLLTITVANLALGFATAIAMHLLGMPNPILWGVMAAALNYIPYLGAMVGVAVVTGVAFLTFDSMTTVAAVGTSYLALTALEGGVLTPMVLGHRLALNPVALFVGLFFWGWLWGVAGALLAVPLLVATKIVCDQVEPLRPLGEFLGPA